MTRRRSWRGGSGRARRGRAAEAGPGVRGRGEAGLARARRGRAAAGRALAAAAAFGRAGRAGCVRAGGLARGIYMVLPRHGSGRGTAAPRSVARQDLPRQRSPRPALATSAVCRATMHGAAQTFGRARAIGAAKSVSLKKQRVLDLILVFKKY